MKSRFTYPLAAAAITAAALSTAGTAAATPVSLDPVAPIADSGSSSPTSGSGGSGSSNVLGTGSSASELINAAICTIQGKKWIPLLDVCI